MTKDPFQPADDSARALARDLTGAARVAALGVIDPETGGPMVSRIAVAPDGAGGILGLVSDLSHHTAALKSNPAFSLLLGDPGTKGDPLTHPRLTVMGRVHFVRHGAPDHATLARVITAHQPKTKLYIGFADFSILRFRADRALLNGGFGKAYRLSASDLS